MEITLQYFDGCPNWQVTDRHLATLLAEGLNATVHYQRIDSHEMAIESRFRGSPTVLIDGDDPFADDHESYGLTCRIYPTGSGVGGSPTVEQLRAITAARQETEPCPQQSTGGSSTG